MTLATIIKNNRKQKKLTQMALSILVGTAVSHICQIEDGTVPSPRILSNLAVALGISKKNLFEYAIEQKAYGARLRYEKRYAI